ncbi:MAG: hypothetical protein JRI39_01765 [Deltaproteobacteria bacterium]|nr:hypothetical protein [Deltaproteobacteria bacterium]MBW2081828.1 hypothetical protein [Deltaproteobacteria bacterium]HDM10350.1 hypothetical protein [Desulfobacteraceae bacterium]
MISQGRNIYLLTLHNSFYFARCSKILESLSTSDYSLSFKDFCLKAAELSGGLLADIPRVLRKIAKKREERLS